MNLVINCVVAIEGEHARALEQTEASGSTWPAQNL